MFKWGIILLLLAAMLAGDAMGDVTTIPASQDVYISMGEDSVSVYNQTDILLCAVNVTDSNGTKIISYPGAPAVQFDISGLNITDNDVAILVLKAAAIQRQNDPVMVALMSIGSDWDESSDYTTFLVNILPAWNIIKKNDATAMSSNTDGDSIFAFDVSKKLMDARAKADKISFFLEAISNSSSEISFLPRESDQGPCLIIMPYPKTLLSDQNTLNSSLQLDQTSEISENMSDAGMQNTLVEKKMPDVGRIQGNKNNTILVFPIGKM